VFMYVSAKLTVEPEGAVIVAEQDHPLPYEIDPAPAWDLKVPGLEREPLGPPQEPPGIITFELDTA
jgi:hypothetical protein